MFVGRDASLFIPQRVTSGAPAEVTSPALWFTESATASVCNPLQPGMSEPEEMVSLWGSGGEGGL